MGASDSKNRVFMADEMIQKTVDQLNMSRRDVRRLWKAFKKFDKDKSGDITVNEFFLALSEEPSIFGDRLFQLIDVDSDNVLTFPEFVRVTGTYCMFGTLDILKFCFFVFDDDKRGYLDFGQVDALVRILNNHKPNANVKVAIKQLDLNQDGRIDFFEFKQMNQKYPMLLRPAFRLQEKMCLKTLGIKWFLAKRLELQKQRQQMSDEEKMKFKAEIDRVEREKRLLLRKKMGFTRYYFAPWQRKAELLLIMAMDTKGLLQVDTGDQQALGNALVNEALGIEDDACFGGDGGDEHGDGDQAAAARARQAKLDAAERRRNRTHHRSETATRQRRADKRKQAKLDKYKSVCDSAEPHVNIADVQKAFDVDHKGHAEPAGVIITKV